MKIIYFEFDFFNNFRNRLIFEEKINIIFWKFMNIDLSIFFIYISWEKYIYFSFLIIFYFFAQFFFIFVI